MRVSLHRKALAISVAVYIFCSVSFWGIAQQAASVKHTDTIQIDWAQSPGSGFIDIVNGRIAQIAIGKGKGKIKGNTFRFNSVGAVRITVMLDSVHSTPGPGATVVSVQTKQHPFSFFLRDVTSNFPVYIPEYEVAVLPSSDNRNYAALKQHFASAGLRTKLQAIENEPEASFAAVENNVRNQHAPTWLGISRDFRMFQVAESLTDQPMEATVITPKFAAMGVPLSQMKNNASAYLYNTGRGQGVAVHTIRSLQNGSLPIVHSTTTDENITYHNTSFVALEKGALQTENTGTDYLVADSYSHGHMFTKEQEAALKSKLKNAFDTTEETVFYFRCEAKNISRAPSYAWFKTPKPGNGWYEQYNYTFSNQTGFSSYAGDSVFCLSRLNGKPLPSEEIAVLLQPGENAVFEFFLPHSPIPIDRATTLSTQSFDKKLTNCIAYWKTKLESGAAIHVPEERVNNMIKAGLLHLDLITYGKEPDSTLAPSIGVYSPIGTESAPIIQFYISMGWHDVAKRCLQYFLDKQHADGMIQNFGGYMVETGAALWTMGEYFRYTRDKEWVIKNKAKLIKSCDFLFAWRERNKKENLRGKGYGMIDGKVADPEDQFHQFMLNGYAYLGCTRVAEMLVEIDATQSARIQKESAAWKEDIRSSFFNSMAHAPVVPSGDGTWIPTVAPWPEMTGPRALFIQSEKFFSHGTFTTADALLGPLYLVFCEVLEPNETAASMMLRYHSELFYQNNVAFSQPYYSRHDWMQAKLGMVKPFLKTYYNAFAALADRETYTFWEHVFHVSVHKTHEEAWFLTQTRWMLYLEDGATLRLLNTAPRDWLADGKRIELNNVSSYYGPLTLNIQSEINKGYIEATISCDTSRGLKDVIIRLPHPLGKKPVKIIGGVYDAEKETVSISPFTGKANIRLEY